MSQRNIFLPFATFYLMCCTTLKTFIISFVFALMPFVCISAQGTSDTPVYTVAEAVEMIEQGHIGEDVYVKGIVSYIASTNVAGEGSINIDISDDGKNKSTLLRLYHNYKGVDEKWTSLSEIGAHDNVVVYGKLGEKVSISYTDKMYSMQNGNYLIKHDKFTPIPMESEVVDFTDVYLWVTGGNENSIGTYSGMSFEAAFDKSGGSLSPKYIGNSKNVRLYKGNTISIKSLTENLISKIEIDYTNKSNTDKNPTVSCGKASYTDNVLVWTMNEPVENATLTVGGTSYFTAITVYYESDSETQAYTREVIPGRVGTICLPYAVETGDFSGARCYETDYVGNGKVYFSEVNRLEAGMPYIFFANDDATEIIAKYSGEPVVEAGTKNGLHGTFEKISINERDNIVVLSGNRLVLCGDNSSLAANRAYLKIDEISTVPTHADGAKRVSFNLNGTPTGIEGVPSDSHTPPSVTYNIAGQRVTPTAKGILIRNGRKYVNMPVSPHRQ